MGQLQGGSPDEEEPTVAWSFVLVRSFKIRSWKKPYFLFFNNHKNVKIGIMTNNMKVIYIKSYILSYRTAAHLNTISNLMLIISYI